jgi:uncharacterized protein (DUF58 family)
LLEVAERRLPALTRLKLPEKLPIRLHRRRIYVVPTRFGLIYSLVLLTMLFGALNYNNNPALLLTCLLAAASYQSVFLGYRSIDGVELKALQSEPCHAGDALSTQLHFSGAARARYGLRLSIEGNEIVFDLSPDGDDRVRIELAAPTRGWQRVGRIRVYSEYPFGLFHVWSWLNPDFVALIYPRLEANAPPLPPADGDTSENAYRRDGDELAMLRDYRPSDPRRAIAWKASARHDRLLVKEFEQRRGQQIVLDWNALRGLDYEARISRLSAWVCMAEQSQTPYALNLTDRRIPVGVGSDHRHACLRELALLPGAAS